MSVLFEVPYNFAESLITFYKRYSSHISYLFLPPYHSDGMNTRTSIETKMKGRCYMPQSRKEYEYHLRKIRNAGLSFLVLWQEPGRLIDREILDYYCGMGASGFIIAEDRNAKIIKEYKAELVVAASLVQRLCANVSKRDFQYYDHIILYYPFNRSLDALKQLTKIKDKIIIMPNTLCHVECPSIHHWFPSRPFDQERDCWVIRDKDHYISRCGFISPEHLYLFDDFIGGYKLQGREFSTELLKHTCQIFFEREAPYDLLTGMLGQEFVSEYQNTFQHINPEEYYNTLTPSLLKKI